MKPNQIFAAMTPERCEQILDAISKESPETSKQIVAAAAVTLKFRPHYLLKQPPAKRAVSVRRALARLQSNQLAEELLAVFFLKCRLELLTEWLDLLGLKHEEGILQDDVIEAPDASELEKHVSTFRGDGSEPDRELLLQTFSAQAAIDWPALDALVEARLETE
jgi:hypothetical protein